MKPQNVLALLLAVVLGVGSLWAANPKHKGTVKVPARIHVSANFEGELEPCG
jgi:hypothetical protein